MKVTSCILVVKFVTRVSCSPLPFEILIIFTMINAQKGAIYFVSLYHLLLQEQIYHFGRWNFCFQVVLVCLVVFFHYMFWSGNRCKIKLYLLLFTMIIWNLIACEEETDSKLLSCATTLKRPNKGDTIFLDGGKWRPEIRLRSLATPLDILSKNINPYCNA